MLSAVDNRNIVFAAGRSIGIGPHRAAGAMAVVTPAKRKISYKAVLLFVILAAGILLHQLGWFDWQRFLVQGEKYAYTWWFAPSLIAAKMLLYAFALPGSTLIWVAGLLYDPFTATMVIVAGGLGGAVAAYALARGMSLDFTKRVASSRFFGFLQRHTDLGTLCAMRTLPNFPHSVINYGAGMLAVPLPRFIVSTLAGFAVKGYLYATMIRHAVTAEDFSGAISWKTVGPLFAIAALFMVGKLIQRYARPAGRG